jgi:hypothetical protein
MSLSAMVWVARAKGSSGCTVKSVLPLTRNMSATFISGLLIVVANRTALGADLKPGVAQHQYSPQSSCNPPAAAGF